MTRPRKFALLGTATLALAAAANAQKPIPLRSLTPAVGTDSGVLRYLDNIRPLANGRVMVNDAIRQRLILFEQTLQRFMTIADSGAGARNYYPPNSGVVIIPYLGDSTVMLDQQAKAFVVISPTGVMVRTIAMPDARDAMILSIGSSGPQGFDERGRLVFVTFRSSQVDRELRVTSNEPKLVVIWTRDSSLIVRRDPATGRTDTLGLIARPLYKNWVLHRPDGRSFSRGAQIPIPTVDEWTLLYDGTVAIVRGHDYHIDWVHPDGTVTSSPKMPFDWLRITTEQKQHIADSVNNAIAARAVAAPPPAPSTPGMFPRPDLTGMPPTSFEADSLPDYYPPVRRGTVKSDPDGNVWILPTTSVLSDGGLVYDVVNRKGEIIERVKLPPGRRLLAVGYRGVVYMGYTPKGGLVRLERATVIR